MSVLTDFLNVVVTINGQEKGKSLSQMQKELKQLNRELAQLPVGTDAWYRKMEEVQRAQKALQSVKNEIKGLGGIFSSLKEQAKQFGAAMLAFLSVQGIISGFKKLVSANAELSDSLADIRKTTGMTAPEVTKLNDEINKINTRTPTEELRKIAIVAGQLGIAKGDVLAFTKATDQLVVSLGDEFKGGAEEITTILGGLRNVFSDIKSDHIDQDMLHIGNALNELGSAGSATAPVVADFANRIGGVGIPLGLTSAQVLALSATMQELNISTERGGTAMTKIFQRMAGNAADFAKVANVPVKEFTKLVNTDLYGAFLKVVEGSNKSGASATALSKILDNLGVDGSGASEVFLKLGKNTGLLHDKLKLSNDALQKTSSVTAEFNTKNETLAGNLSKIGKSMTSAFVNSSVMHGLESIVGWVAKWVEEPLEAKIEAERTQLGMLQVKLLDVNLSHADRVKLVEQLKSQYPEYLKNINAETVSNQELNAVLDKVNDGLIAKIILQKKQKEIDDQADETANTVAKRLANEAALQSSISEAHSKYGYVLKDNISTVQQAAEAEAYMHKFLKDNGEQWHTNTQRMQYGTDVLHALQLGQYEWIHSKVDENTSTGVLNSLLQQQIDLKKQLGILDKEEKPVDMNGAEAKYWNSNNPKPPVPEPVDDKEAQKELDKYKDLVKQLQEAQHQLDLSRMTSREREIQQVKDKYDKLRELAKGHAKEMEEIEDLQENELHLLRRKHYEEERKEYLKQQEDKKKSKEDAMRAFGKAAKEALMTDNQREIYEEGKKWDALIAQAKAYGIDATKLEQAKADHINAIIKKQKKDQKDIVDEGNKELLDKELKYATDSITIATNLASTFSSIADLLLENSESQAAFQKSLTAFQIGLETALAVAQAIRAAAGQPFPANIIAITTSMAAVFGAMKKVKELFADAGDPPKAERGAILNGPSHANNGINLYDDSGKAIVNAEGGEPVFVLSKKSYKNNKQLVDALMYSSMRGNGDPVELQPFNYKPRGINFSSTQRAVRFDRGNAASNFQFSPGSSTGGTRSHSNNDAVLLELKSVITRLTRRLDMPFHAQLNYDNFTQDQKAIDDARLSGRIGK